ncbi:protein kinase domain-containing protein [Pendulispora albinea]|uniref:Protein kinase n=1 Tax=Pendulispora albinea TaxID=2741071 RepID=A0ABZ2M6U6_9BACT
MSVSPEVGVILAGKYRVERVLGAGGMGVVVAARHLQLESLVALKLMVPAALDVEGSAERFRREAQAVARLRGEHIAHVTDFGILDTGRPYIVMEFLDGADLDTVLNARGRLPAREAIDYVIDVCKAMVEAHDAGIVHRDLKPHNLFRTNRPDGTTLVKVLDFGISKFIGVEGFDAASTETGALLGSPAYMSPEQIRSSKHVDARTDIYALGAILFQFVTGERVFRAASLGEMLVSVIHDAPRSIRQVRPELPADLDAVVARCLQKDPSKRFASARELLIALQSVRSSRRSSPAVSSEILPLNRSVVLAVASVVMVIAVASTLLVGAARSRRGSLATPSNERPPPMASSLAVASRSEMPPTAEVDASPVGAGIPKLPTPVSTSSPARSATPLQPEGGTSVRSKAIAPVPRVQDHGAKEAPRPTEAPTPRSMKYPSTAPPSPYTLPPLGL